MADEKYNKNLLITNDADSSDEGESGGQGSQIAFADFIGTGTSVREILVEGQLSYEQQKHLDWKLTSTHEANVIKQFEKVENMRRLKSGATSLETYRAEKGMGSSASSSYKSHPAFAKSAQFSGIDPQVNSLPDLSQTNTNNENKNELRLQHSLRHQPKHAPGYSPPQLKRQ